MRSAGAIALVFNDFNNRSATGPAVTSAINAAEANAVGLGQVDVGPEDVTFPTGPTGREQPGRRPSSSGRFRRFSGLMFGMTSMQSRAYAEAEASPANAARCLLPFMLPDKWREVTAPPWSQESMFEMYDKQAEIT